MEIRKHKPDLTRNAVTRQLKAMGCLSFEIGLYSREKDTLIPRTWTANQVIKSIPYLKRQNAGGLDIFIRPEGSQGLVFFDDLNRATIDRLTVDGLAPAVLIQSSPLNYHGWLKVSDSPIEPELATAVCKVLATRYGGDKDSADWRHFGRLAGFTNRKPEHIEEDGKRPFVLLSSGNGRMVERAGDLLADARAYLEEQARIWAERAAQMKEAANRAPAGHLPNHCDYYDSQLRGLTRRFGADLDGSRADWMIVTKMLETGYNADQVRDALLSCSPAVHKRQRHADKYITVTLNNAMGIKS